jgi:sugar (pentulose or hexulose) kinase
LEGVAFYYRWMIEEMEQTGLEIKAINAIGGGCTSQTWIQIMCDVTGRTLQVVEWPHEAGSIGAALTVAVGLGYYPDLDSVEPLVHINRIVEPRIDGNNLLYDALYREYVSIGKGLIPGFAQLSTFHS